MGTKGIRGALAALVSGMPWLANKPSGNVGFSTMWASALLLDGMIETARQGLQIAWPGKGDASGLVQIGKTRGILQGIGESNSAYAARLRAWLDTAQNMGSDFDLAGAIQAYLQTDQIVRIVDRSGNWTSLHPDGTWSYVTGVPLNWDTTSNPERSGDWSDIWIVAYDVPSTDFPTYAGISPFAGWIWGTGMNPNGWGTGHRCTRANVAAISQIVANRRGAHTRLRAIIWSYDATLFDPANPGSLPTGTWGEWGTTVSGVRVQSRSSSARYWIPFDGAGAF